MTQSIQTTELALATEYAAELQRLIEKMDWSRDYGLHRLSLHVEISNGQPKFRIEAAVGKDYSNRVQVEGPTLGVVMDEVYRRLNYNDKSAAQIEGSLLALAAPQES